MNNFKELSLEERNELLSILHKRFEKNMHRHKGVEWADVQNMLEANPKKLWSLSEMEDTGGEPDIVQLGDEKGEFVFCDCSAESPKGRRSLCYDRAAWEARKEHKPASNAMETAAGMGIELLDEAHYRALQKFGPVDQKTSSWIKTPDNIRNLGGAIFGDYRYGTVFIYHNGAEAYYAARGFRGLLKI